MENTRSTCTASIWNQTTEWERRRQRIQQKKIDFNWMCLRWTPTTHVYYTRLTHTNARTLQTDQNHKRMCYRRYAGRQLKTKNKIKNQFETQLNQNNVKVSVWPVHRLMLTVAACHNWAQLSNTVWAPNNAKICRLSIRFDVPYVRNTKWRARQLRIFNFGRTNALRPKRRKWNLFHSQVTERMENIFFSVFQFSWKNFEVYYRK